MEYKLKPKVDKPTHKKGDKRSRKIFLFLPYLLDRRLRWLEYANVNEEYRRYTVLIPEGRSYQSLKWFRMSWAD